MFLLPTLTRGEGRGGQGGITACLHSQHILCIVEELLPVGLAGMFHVVE